MKLICELRSAQAATCDCERASRRLAAKPVVALSSRAPHAQHSGMEV